MAVKALMSILSGSGGLELNIGGFKDVLPPKQGSTAPWLVEAQHLLNINKKIFTLRLMPFSSWETTGQATFPTGSSCEMIDEAAPGDDDHSDLFEEPQID